MTQQNLGRLERVDLRDIWTTEATDFTPWLARAENLSQQAEHEREPHPLQPGRRRYVGPHIPVGCAHGSRPTGLRSFEISELQP